MNYQIVSQLDLIDSFFESSGGSIFWRGHDLFTSKAVFEVEKTGDSSYKFTVMGSKGNPYHVNFSFSHRQIMHSWIFCCLIKKLIKMIQ